MGDLKPNTGYYFRLQLLDDGEIPYLWGQAFYAHTLPAPLSDQPITDYSFMNQNTSPLLSNPAAIIESANLYTALMTAVTASGLGPAPANQKDAHYHTPIGMGGLDGLSGNPGACVVLILYSQSSNRAEKNQAVALKALYFSFASAPQQFSLQTSLTLRELSRLKNKQVYVTFKCWGGGGGGGFKQGKQTGDYDRCLC